jgi:hypothetical protein
MALIPRRLAYRALAELLHGQATALEGRTAGRSGARGGPEARAPAAAKLAARRRKAAELRYQAVELSRRVGAPGCYHGPGLDPALLGWLCTLALDHAEARAEIERLAGPGVMGGVDWVDVPTVLDRLMPTEGGA